jgi:exopolyphosphatase/guanosine-5'-triphosphate,3'-diphosphate pyrophosphatase
VREAENGGDFLQRVRRELGLNIRVVSAREEARLIYLGVRHEVNLGARPHFIVDVGGGSVEFIVGDAEKPAMLESRKLGASRMTARYVSSDPISPNDLKGLLHYYDRELSPVCGQVLALRPVAALGTSGTLENLAAMCAAHEGRDGAPVVLHRGALSRLVARLLESRSKDRAAMEGLDEQRRDQVTAGALLMNELFRRLELKEMRVCRSALREGILLDYLSRHAPELSIRRTVPDPRRRSVLDLARRVDWHAAHGEQVARLTTDLFNQTRRLHGLGAEERELIAFGAMLHDIGWHIGRTAHHKHSHYLILHGDLKNFAKSEIAIIANVARYHRKSAPATRHKGYAKLSKRARRVVDVGAALLRIADGLDRSHCAVISSVRCRVGRHHVDVAVKSRGDAALELWGARQRMRLFTRVFDRSISFEHRDE